MVIHEHRKRISQETDTEKNPDFIGLNEDSGLVPEEGLEPPRYCYRWILSPVRLPFRHSGAVREVYSKSHGCCQACFLLQPQKHASSATPSNGIKQVESCPQSDDASSECGGTRLATRNSNTPNTSSISPTAPPKNHGLFNQATGESGAAR